jgi:hypothetical protein
MAQTAIGPPCICSRFCVVRRRVRCHSGIREYSQCSISGHEGVVRTHQNAVFPQRADRATALGSRACHRISDGRNSKETSRNRALSASPRSGECVAPAVAASSVRRFASKRAWATNDVQPGGDHRVAVVPRRGRRRNGRRSGGSVATEHAREGIRGHRVMEFQHHEERKAAKRLARWKGKAAKKRMDTREGKPGTVSRRSYPLTTVQPVLTPVCGTVPVRSRQRRTHDRPSEVAKTAEPQRNR